MNSKIIVGIIGGIIIFGFAMSLILQRSVGDSQFADQQNNASANHSLNKNTADVSVGKTIDPIDKNKVIDSDQFRYQLLDVREDVDALTNKKVWLLLLTVQRIAPNDSTDPNGPQTGLSVAEVDLAKVADYTRTSGDMSNAMMVNVSYDRMNISPVLSEDVEELAVGEQVTGYYVYTVDDSMPSAYFIVRNIGVDSIGSGAFMEAAGYFQIR